MNLTRTPKLDLRESGRDSALRCPRPRGAGGINCAKWQTRNRFVPSPDAALGEGDGAARHPYQLRRSGLKLKSGGRTRRAFSLLEVMIAIGIFFMSTFVILSLVSSSLQNARRLQRPIVDAAMLAAELSLTNKLVEVTDSGDFGEMYPGYSWTSEIIEVGSNKLFQVNYVVQKDGSREVMQAMSVLFYRPESPAGSLDGATTSRR